MVPPPLWVAQALLWTESQRVETVHWYRWALLASYQCSSAGTSLCVKAAPHRPDPCRLAFSVEWRLEETSLCDSRDLHLHHCPLPGVAPFATCWYPARGFVGSTGHHLRPLDVALSRSLLHPALDSVQDSANSTIRRLRPLAVAPSACHP